ncbi:hypothetical protein Tco_0826093 [Tanacetum coccineum]
MNLPPTGYNARKRIAYLVVENYIKNTWRKYELVKSMMNSANSEDGLSVIAAKLGTPLMLNFYTFAMCMESWCRLSFARTMIELRADVELKDTIRTSVPKLVGDRQATRGVQVVPKLWFKRTKQVYQAVSKKNGANISGKQKQAEVTRQEVSNLNLFDALNSVENDDELGMNGWNLKSFEALVDADYDPYDDDSYDGYDMPENLQGFAAVLAILVIESVSKQTTRLIHIESRKKHTKEALFDVGQSSDFHRHCDTKEYHSDVWQLSLRR